MDYFRLIFLDFESQVGDVSSNGEYVWLDKHVVTHTVISSRCEQCIEPEYYCAVSQDDNQPPPPQSLRQRPYCRGQCVDKMRFETTGTNTALDQTCDFLFRNTSNNCGIVLAHNAGGYDGHFLLEWLLKNREAPEIVAAGSKFFKLKIKGRSATKRQTNGIRLPPINNLTVLDSFLFAPIGLSKFAQTFGLQTTKGYFPVLANCPHFWRDNSGRWPGVEYFSPKNVKEESSINEFLAEKRRLNEPFRFRDEIFKYCEADVQVVYCFFMVFKNIHVLGAAGRDADISEADYGNRRLLLFQ